MAASLIRDIDEQLQKLHELYRLYLREKDWDTGNESRLILHMVEKLIAQKAPSEKVEWILKSGEKRLEWEWNFLMARGKYLQYIGNLEESIRDFSKAAELGHTPSCVAHTFLILAELHEKLENHGGALKAARSALNAYPGLIRAQNLFARLVNKNKKRDTQF